MIRVTRAQLAERLLQRPPGYYDDIRAALVEESDDHLVFDDAHPAWLRAVEKYGSSKPRRERPRDTQSLWAVMHRRAFRLRHGQLRRVPRLLEAIETHLPCGDCRDHWHMLMRQHPLPTRLTSKAFFNWTVDRHNDVNRRIGKPAMSRAAAHRRWAT